MSVVATERKVEIKVEKKNLSVKEKISYGMGDFGNGFMFDLGQLYLLKFLQMWQASCRGCGRDFSSK